MGPLLGISVIYRRHFIALTSAVVPSKIVGPFGNKNEIQSTIGDLPESSTLQDKRRPYHQASNTKSQKHCQK